MRSEPTVSVVINNYNYAQYLGAAIDSALNQTYRRTEVVVVDDGSFDDSSAIISGYGKRVRPVLKANGGQASAFNAGFGACHGDIVIYLDADDTLLPQAVETAVPFFDDPRVAKLHWPLWLMAGTGELLDETLPTEELPEGDFRETIINQGPDSYLSAPTSGNAWSRRVLERVLPVPEDEYRKGADGYLLTVTPLLGTIRRSATPLGCYRVHGRNQFWCEQLDQRVERSLARYEHRSRSLAEFLAASSVDVDPAAWKTRNAYYQWLTRVWESAQELSALVPNGERFILADDGQWGPHMLTGRTAIPFLEKDGQYWGSPSNDDHAIEGLGRLRALGVPFFAFGWPAFWWMDVYTGFVQHLKSTSECIFKNDRLVVFKL